LQEALENVTTDNVELHKIVIVLENEQRESERIERQLIQEVEALREHIGSLKSERQQEETRLKEIIRQLKAELYDLGMEKGAANGNAGRNQPQNNSFWSRMSNLTLPLNCCLQPVTLPCIRDENQRDDVLEISYPGVVLYNQRKYPVTAEGGPAFQNGVGQIVQSGPGYPVTRGAQKDIYTTRDFSRQPQRTKGEFEDNHKISAPVPPLQEYNTRGGARNFNHQRILTTHEEVEAVEAAARAFLSVFVNLRANIKRELWNSMLEMHGGAGLLNINHLGGLLHRLVVYAYNEDNPHQSPPSPVRTKPLVSLLKLRLAPYLKGRQYISFEHFKMFSIWLQPREALQMPMPPSNLSNQNQPVRGDDARRQLQVGSACFIWSEGGRRWCEGEVIASKFDKEGEWLVVRYCSNEKWSEKEVQRYSDLVWGITPS